MGRLQKYEDDFLKSLRAKKYGVELMTVSSLTSENPGAVNIDSMF